MVRFFIAFKNIYAIINNYQGRFSMLKEEILEILELFDKYKISEEDQRNLTANKKKWHGKNSAPFLNYYRKDAE